MASSFEQLATFYAVEKRLRSHFSVFLIIPIFVINPKIKNSGNKTCNAQEVHPDKWEVKQRIHGGNRKIDHAKQSMLNLFAIAIGIISSIIRRIFCLVPQQNFQGIQEKHLRIQFLQLCRQHQKLFLLPTLDHHLNQ
jgi:hypothetical protein